MVGKKKRFHEREYACKVGRGEDVGIGGRELVLLLLGLSAGDEELHGRLVHSAEGLGIVLVSRLGDLQVPLRTRIVRY